MKVRTYLLYIIFCVALLNRSKLPPGAASAGFVVDIVTWQTWQTIGEKSWKAYGKGNQRSEEATINRGGGMEY